LGRAKKVYTSQKDAEGGLAKGIEKRSGRMDNIHGKEGKNGGRKRGG